ncbi:unnamed protein product [Mytilus edulis]|uniref:C-type lectin domain-containing protein n=1 Tax=Mytilus edulis TaxID=6550 RepID=A0A8S3SFM3_MYTED|nr:unnamed protein product [Mytilus edulis]
MDGLLTFIIFVTLLSYCEPWFFDGVLDHGNVQRCPQSIPRDNFLYALNDTCIQLIREEHSWNDARRYCTQHHGDLVVIQDTTKQQFIMNALKTSGWVKNGIWIGGTDREREGHWKWVNGQKMTWGNWERGQGPGHKGFLFSGGQFEDCAVIRKDDGYKWHDYACNLPSYRYGSICEYHFTPTTTHRTATQTSTTPATTTQSSTTPAPTTQTSTTPAPTTQTSTTPAPTTQTSTTPAPTTQTSTTPAPTTQTSTTPAPTTQSTTTPAPTTQSTTTPATTTQLTTTPAPTTQSTTTPAPTTQSSTTPVPTTQSTTTPVPSTQIPTTKLPTSQPSTTPSPTTQISTTTLPITQKSTTPVPITRISTTTLPTTKSTKPPAQTINLDTTSPTPLQTTTPVPSTNVPSTLTAKVTSAKLITTWSPVSKSTQLVNNQGGLLRRSDNGQKPANKSSTGYIIGGVCAAVVVAGIIVAVFVIRRRRLSSNDANRTVHGAENPMYSVMYDDASVPPLIREEHSWNDARRYCTQHHGDLVVIQDMTKQQFIMNALKTSDWVKNGIWIGGTDREKEGHWKWVNGQNMTWGNWERGHGNTGFLFSGGQFEDCAVIRIDDRYKWHDYACNLPSYHYGSICEYNFTQITPRSTTIMSKTITISVEIRPSTTVSPPRSSTVLSKTTPPKTTMSTNPKPTNTLRNSPARQSIQHQLIQPPCQR